MRFISIKDPHLSFGFQNRIRFDYENDVSKKLNFITTYLVENEISHVVATGDIVDSSYEDKWSFKKYRVNKRKFQEITRVAKLYSNVGNHDYFHGFENSDNTVFGELVDEGVVINLTVQPLIEVSYDSCIIVQGIDHAISREQVEVKLHQFNNMNEVFGKRDKHLYKVAVMHSNVTPKEVEHITDFTYNYLIETFPNIDMFICGHYHLGYQTKKIVNQNGKEITFVNNWNLTRVVRDYQVEMGDHTPEFEDINIQFDSETTKFNVQTKTIEVPHKPYDEAFRAKEVSILRKTNSEKFNFFKEINITELISNMDLTDQEQIVKLNDLREENGYKKFSDDVLNKAITYLNN